MRVRVLRDFSTVGRVYHIGETVEIDPRKAEAWLRAGLVMQDKSLDGAGETKIESSPHKVTSTKRKTRR